jgi:hypothetical protein
MDGADARLGIREVESVRQFLLMKDSADENAVSGRLVEDDVLALLKAAKTSGEHIAWPPDAWLLRNQIKAIQKESEVSFSLSVAPSICGIEKNLGEIGSCLFGQVPGAHALRFSPI